MTTVIKDTIHPRRPQSASKHLLPKSLVEAAGIMKSKRKALEKHLQTVRKEWK